MRFVLLSYREITFCFWV